MSELKPLRVPPPTTEEYGGFKVTREYVPMDEFERGIKTADMVSVVRCKDCKYLCDDGSTWGCGWHCSCLTTNDGTPPDGFCAWAERREP